MQYLEFGPFRLDPADHRLLRNGDSLLLPPKAFDTLVCLAQNSGRLVTRDELLKAVWPDSFVEDGSLSVSISQIRRVLGEMESGEPYIETVPRKGYRFRPTVTVVQQPLHAAAAASSGNGHAIGTRAIASTPPGERTERPEVSSDRRPELIVVKPSSSATVPQRHLKTIIIWIAATLILAIGVGWGLHLWRAVPEGVSRPFASMRMTRLTSRGEVEDVAISPDGNYVAYVLDEVEGQSIWLRQVYTQSDVQRLAAEPGDYFSLKFSPDGNYLYYGHTTEKGERNLYRMPVLGGSSVQILSEVTGPVSFSPDGSKFALIRMNSSKWQASLVVANADGGNLTVVRTRTRPQYYSPTDVAWSADGKSLFCFAGEAANYNREAFRVVRVALNGGAESQVISRSWPWADSMVRLSNSDDLIISASDDSAEALQIWSVSPLTGTVLRITNDLNSYGPLSLTGDGQTLATVQRDESVGLWIAPVRQLDNATPISAESIERFRGLNWSPDNKRIVFTALADEKGASFSIDPESGRVSQFPGEAQGEQNPVYTPNGEYIVYAVRGHIWRMNHDGTGRQSLTTGARDVHPSISADGLHVLYASFENWSPAIGGKPTLQSISIDGGKPLQLTDASTSFPQISPDGKSIVAAYFPGGDPRYSESDIALFSPAGGPPRRVFKRVPHASGDAVYWAPGGNALDYIVSSGGVGNIWRQPLSGGAPQQITHFKTGELFDFAWSPDGQRLALARGKDLRDVVLIRNAATEPSSRATDSARP